MSRRRAYNDTEMLGFGLSFLIGLFVLLDAFLFRDPAQSKDGAIAWGVAALVVAAHAVPWGIWGLSFSIIHFNLLVQHAVGIWILMLVKGLTEVTMAGLLIGSAVRRFQKRSPGLRTVRCLAGGATILFAWVGVFLRFV